MFVECNFQSLVNKEPKKNTTTTICVEKYEKKKYKPWVSLV